MPRRKLRETRKRQRKEMLRRKVVMVTLKRKKVMLKRKNLIKKKRRKMLKMETLKKKEVMLKARRKKKLISKKQRKKLKLPKKQLLLLNQKDLQKLQSRTLEMQLNKLRWKKNSKLKKPKKRKPRNRLLLQKPKKLTVYQQKLCQLLLQQVFLMDPPNFITVTPKSGPKTCQSTSKITTPDLDQPLSPPPNSLNHGVPILNDLVCFKINHYIQFYYLSKKSHYYKCLYIINRLLLINLIR